MAISEQLWRGESTNISLTFTKDSSLPAHCNMWTDYGEDDQGMFQENVASWLWGSMSN